MSIETLWYEVSPFIYGIVGVAALSGAQTAIGIISGGLLIAAAATVIRMRWVYRRNK